jgi:hypothetical protein
MTLRVNQILQISFKVLLFILSSQEFKPGNASKKDGLLAVALQTGPG